MEFRTAFPKPRTHLGVALLLGAAASVLYLVVAQFLAVLTEPPFTGGSHLLLFGFAFGTVGVPVALWFRFELRAPLGLLAGVLVFWHGFVFLVGSGGDAPLFGAVLFFTPLYLVAYALVSAGEAQLRRRGHVSTV